MFRESLDPVSGCDRSNAFNIAAIGAVLALGVLGYPMVEEEASGHCSAVELKFADCATSSPGHKAGPFEAAFVRAMVGYAKGKLAETIVKKAYPNLAPALACEAAYWTLMLNPDMLNAAL